MREVLDAKRTSLIAASICGSVLRVVECERRSDVLLNPPVYPETPAGIFATGGETASRFLRSTDARGLSSVRELLPAIAGGLVLGGRYNGTVLITKAGGFGAPDAILCAIDSVRTG